MFRSIKNDALTQEQSLQLADLANQIKLKNVFSTRVEQILQIETIQDGITLEFLLPPLLSAIGFYLSTSTIEAFPNSQQSLCIYSSLVAQPSTGKTQAIQKVKKAFEMIEKYYQVHVNDSRLSNTATIESLLDLLNRLNSIIAFYDEGSTFWSSMGRYGGDGKYEKGYYLTIWSATDAIERDLKGERTKIYNARLQLSLCAHPVQIVNQLNYEKSVYDDGFSHRILFSCPEPPYCRAEHIRESPKSIICLHSIFLFMRLVHLTSRNYTFEKQAILLIDAEFNKYKEYVKRANKFDSFLGAMFGKATTHLIRSCMILKAFHEACNHIDGISGADQRNITQELETNCIKIIETLPTNSFLIESVIVEKAKALVHYFLMNKLVLASYSVNPTSDFETTVEELLGKHEQKAKISGRFLYEQPKIIQIMRRILFFNKNHSPTANLIAGGNDHVIDVELAMSKLVENGIGKCIKDKAGNNKLVTTYQPISHMEITSNPSLGKVIQDLGCDLNKFIHHLASMEFFITERMKNKRKRDDSDQHEDDRCLSPQSKKPKKNFQYSVIRINKKNNCPYPIASNSKHIIQSQSKPNKSKSNNAQIQESQIEEEQFVEQNHEEDLIDEEQCLINQNEDEDEDEEHLDDENQHQEDGFDQAEDEEELELNTQQQQTDEQQICMTNEIPPRQQSLTSNFSHSTQKSDEVVFNNSTVQSKCLGNYTNRINTKDKTTNSQINDQSQQTQNNTHKARGRPPKINKDNQSRKHTNLSNNYDDNDVPRRINSSRMLGESTNIIRSSPRLASKIKTKLQTNTQKKIEKLKPGDF